MKKLAIAMAAIAAVCGVALAHDATAAETPIDDEVLE